MTQTTIKGFSVRVAMMLLMMLLTAKTAWAFKAETTSYTISYSSNQFQITTGSTVTASWTASTLQSQIYWKENESHQLAGMTIRPNQNVFYVSNSMHTTLNTSTTFTFTAPSTIAITSVVFKNGSNVVSGTNTASGSSYTVTLASGTSFTGFDVTYGTISGWCGTNATWSLSGTNYTVLTISGSGAMNDYGHDNASIWHTDAPWGYDLTSVTIGNGITSIGQYAFIGCQQLSSVTIGTSVTTLGAYAFNHCDALTQVTLPASVASIGDQCFRNSANLQRVNIQRTDGLITLGDKVFNGCNNLQYIVAPTPTLALQYKDATNWNASKDKLRVKFGGYLFSVTNEGGADAYAITDETDLRNLASVLNNNSEGIANGKTFRQTGDITLSNADFEPIGYNDYHYFTGTYDGGGDYTISGLNVGDYGALYNYGLFGYVKNGTVKNVRLVSPTVSANGQGTSLGSLIGKTNNATVKNCVVFNPHYGTSGSYNGAIIGSNSSSTLENLYFYGGNFNNAIGGSYSGTAAVRVRKVTLGSGITSVTPAATDIANGFVHNNDRYYREGLELTLTNNLSGKTGYHITYKATYNNGSKTLDGNTYTVNSTDGDVTLTAVYTPIDYTITYYLNGGTLTTDKNSYTIESPDITLDTPTRTGFIFGGWYDNANLTGSAVTTITHGSSGNKQFWAKWTPTNYPITYHLNGGTLDTDKNSYNIESPDITLDTPTRTGYIFDGWYTNSNLTGTPVTTITHGSTGDKQFWAKWTLTDYTITYNLNGGTLDTDKNSYTMESPDITLDTPTREGYTFGGWYTNANLTGNAVTTIAHGSTENKEFWAKWTLTDYTITYHLNGGTLDTDKNSYTFESPDITLDTPTREGYTFGGWYTNANLTGNAVTTIAHGSTENKEFWAKWTLTDYTITYHLNGGTLDTDKNSYTIESPDITLDTPTREGYTFGGWYTNANLTGNAVTTIAHGSTENKEFYAKWTLTDYTITYHLNGGTLDTDKNSYTFESPDITLDTPTREGYTFGGWYTNANLTGNAVTTIAHGSTENKEFWAKWTPISYTIPYIDADGKTQTCSDFTVLTNATDISDLSSGWYVVSEDVSYSSQFLCLSGDIHLILCDGAKMTVEDNSNPAVYSGGSLTIYAQSTDSSMGQLIANGSKDDAILAPGSITICGGNITATGNYYGIRALWGGITIHSGQVNASGGDYGIYAPNGNITLGWRNVGDRITASSYYAPRGAVKTADGQSLYNGSEVISGTVSESDWGKLNGKTLIPYIESTFADDGTAILYDNDAGLPDDHRNANRIATLADSNTHDIMLLGRTLYKDGAWNTLCLPFDVTIADSPLAGDGVDVRTLAGSDFSNGTLTLDFTDKDAVTTLEAGKPYIIRWASKESPAENLVNPIFNGVTVSTATANVETDCVDFIGILSPTVLYEDGAEKTNLYMGSANKLYYPTVEGFKLNACRGYFKLKGVVVNGNGNGNGVRSFNINFGDDATGIVEMRDEKGEMRNGHEYEDGGWYTVDGRRLDGKPTRPGVYINSGRQVVIK